MGEWEKEVLRNPKKVIVAMLRNVAKERDDLYAAQPSVQADGFWACAECGYQNVNALDICTHCFNRRR